MRELTVKILLRLPLDTSRMLEFVAELQRLFFDPQDSPLRITAGKALTNLVRSRGVEFGHEFPDIHIQRLLRIISTQAEYIKEYRAVTAEMLGQICAKYRTDEDRNRLRSVACALTAVFKAIATETTNIPNNDTRKFLASFLGLAVQIGERLASAEEFANALTEITRENINCAEELKGIIEDIYCAVQVRNKINCAAQQSSIEDYYRAAQLKKIIEARKDDEDEVWLAIMKAATKLVTMMLQIHNRPSYVQFFREADLVDKLDTSVKAMADIERYVGMATVADDEIERYETLQTLVATAKEILAPSQ